MLIVHLNFLNILLILLICSFTPCYTFTPLFGLQIPTSIAEIKPLWTRSASISSAPAPPPSDSLTTKQLEKEITYYLYIPNSAEEDEQFIPVKDNSKELSKFWNKNGEIKVIAHGWHAFMVYNFFELVKSESLENLAESFHKLNSSINVIIMDWSSLSLRVNYNQAAENTRMVGVHLAKFLVNLKKNNAFDKWSAIHLIGYSLGAHLSGVAGLEIQKMSQGAVKLSRITGIDPAGPLFDTNAGELPSDLSGFLDKSDAEFVDIIHCNMGRFSEWAPLTIKPGSIVQAGTADFYPNGGETQSPYCSQQQDKLACSHKVCVLLYIKSLTKPRLACPCNSWADFKGKKCPCDEDGSGVYMGEFCSRSAKGKYYLTVKDKINIGDMMSKWR